MNFVAREKDKSNLLKNFLTARTRGLTWQAILNYTAITLITQIAITYEGIIETFHHEKVTGWN